MVTTAAPQVVGEMARESEWVVVGRARGFEWAVVGMARGFVWAAVGTAKGFEWAVEGTAKGFVRQGVAGMAKDPRAAAALLVGAGMGKGRSGVALEGAGTGAP